MKVFPKYHLRNEQRWKLKFTICQTCMMLSSDTEQITQGSFGFQEKSDILAVCPPWMNWQEKEIKLKKNSSTHPKRFHFSKCKKLYTIQSKFSSKDKIN